MKLNELECKVDFFDFDENLYQELEASPLKDAFLITLMLSKKSILGINSISFKMNFIRTNYKNYKGDLILY